MCPRQESNLHRGYRKPISYPLNDEGVRNTVTQILLFDQLLYTLFMSVSIYYNIKRNQGLSQDEERCVQVIKEKYSVDDKVEAFSLKGEGANWSPFFFYPKDKLESGEILAGSTELPDTTEEVMIEGAKHFLKALSEIRRCIPDAQYDISINDAEVTRDEKNSEYILN